jgi:hypothetical protein
MGRRYGPPKPSAGDSTERENETLIERSFKNNPQERPRCFFIFIFIIRD